MSGSNERGRIFGYEVQHEIPLEIGTNPDAIEGLQLLQDVGYDLEARGNKMGLLINSSTRDAILAGPANIVQATKDASFGLNVHDSRSDGARAIVDQGPVDHRLIA